MLTLLNFAAVLTMQTPPTPPPPPHMRTETRVVVMGDHDGPGGLDKDGDGQLTREEFTGPMNEAFARMDTNGDGRLSQEELRAGHGPGGSGGEHEFMIRNGGPEGGPRGHRMMMRRGGPDGAAGERNEERIMVVTGGAPGGDGGERNVFVHRTGPGEGPMTWQAAGDGARIEIERSNADDLDTDGDGKISEAEFLAPMRAAFARMDADGSGAIEASEKGGEHQVRVITRHRDGPGDQ